MEATMILAMLDLDTMEQEALATNDSELIARFYKARAAVENFLFKL